MKTVGSWFVFVILGACGGGEVFHVDPDVGTGYEDFAILTDAGGTDGLDDPDAPADGDDGASSPDQTDSTPDADAGASVDLLQDLAEDAAPEDGDLEDDDIGPTAPPTFVEGLTVEEVGTEAPWVAVRRLSFTHPGLGADEFIERTRQMDSDVVTFFGDNEPPSGVVLLYEGPGCATAGHGWLLLHGAGSHADESWIAPPDLLAQGHGQTLIDEGECVFAVTFPHPFGDCFNQAIELAAAVEAILADGAVAELTLVGHSKGGIAAVAWLSGFADVERSLAPPAPDLIRRLVLLGAPLGGTDFSFRHPAFNYPVELMSLRMPSSWDEILEWGVWKDILDESIYGGAYPGILQITAAWDEVYDLPVWEQDWYTTYYGGQGFVSHSLGIGEAITLGGVFMDGLRQHALPVEVPVRMASGGNPLVNGIPWESSGPSDGLVFKESAENTAVITALEDMHHFPLANHLDLLHRGTVYQWMTESP